MADDLRALRRAGFRELLEHGEPLEIADLAKAAGIDERSAQELLEENRGRVELDDAGRLVGIAGLSLTPGRHKLEIDGRTRWAWCALDAVGILGALESNGRVQSTDPLTDETIVISFLKGSPDPDTAIFIAGGFGTGNVRADWCPLVNFFETLEAAQQWVGRNQAEGEVLLVKEVAQRAAEMWRPLMTGSAAI